MKRRSRPIRSRTSAGGRDQFSELKEKIVSTWMPISPAARTVRAQRLDAAAMAFGARQAARGRPAPVAIHDDGDMARHLEGGAGNGCGHFGLRHRHGGRKRPAP